MGAGGDGGDGAGFAEGPDLLLDDGGDLVSTLHTIAPREVLDGVRGGCEGTTTGVLRLRRMAAVATLAFPMIAASDKWDDLLTYERPDSWLAARHELDRHGNPQRSKRRSKAASMRGGKGTGPEPAHCRYPDHDFPLPNSPVNVTLSGVRKIDDAVNREPRMHRPAPVRAGRPGGRGCARGIRRA